MLTFRSNYFPILPVNVLIAIPLTPVTVLQALPVDPVTPFNPVTQHHPRIQAPIFKPRGRVKPYCSIAPRLKLHGESKRSTSQTIVVEALLQLSKTNIGSHREDMFNAPDDESHRQNFDPLTMKPKFNQSQTRTPKQWNQTISE